MPIFNIANNVSEDYVYIVSPEEIFYDIQSLPAGVYVYNESWTDISEDNDFEEQYDTIKNTIVSYTNNVNRNIQLSDTNDDFLEILEEFAEDENNQYMIYVGVPSANQANFPYNQNIQYFVVMIDDNSIVYVPIKSIYFANTKIIDIDNYTTNDNEYLSATQTLNLVISELTKIRLFEVLANKTQLDNLTNPQTNRIYFVQKESDANDGLNITFDLYAYNPDYTSNNDKFRKLDDIAFNPNDFARANHSHEYITNDGKITTTVSIANDDYIVITDTSNSDKVKRVAYLSTANIKDSLAHSNIGSSASDNQSTINDKIDTALGLKVNTANVYTKSEIDDMIEDIQDFIHS